MTDLGLYIWNEAVKNSPRTLSAIPKIASKIEIMDKGLVVKKISNWQSIPVIECYFSPRWNFTGALVYPLTAKLVSLFCRKKVFWIKNIIYLMKKN